MGAMRQLYMSVLACWNWASVPIEDREPEVMIPANPLKGVRRPKKGPPQGVTEWPLARRVLRLARGWARQRARTRRERTRATRWIKTQALALIAYSGARTSEAVTLEWGDIRWGELVAEIPRDRHKTGSRTDKIRRFPLLARAIKLLRAIERWPHRHPKYVFATSWQEAPKVRQFWEWIRLDLKPYLARNGVELPAGWRPYWLRHSFGTTALEETNADLAASALGHSPEVLRAVYDHVSAARVRKVGKAVDDARRRRDRD
jgi:integrase